MTDAQDTIELPVFGLTLKREPWDGEHERFWLGLPGRDRVYAATAPGGIYINLAIHRASGTDVHYHRIAEDADACCAFLLAEMTPDDVAAIRSLGEP